ncbi:hypothetical protein [Halochromatium salexigens]|uniref:Uncharacterized protein n=1 Tax=Halochromatium salexigens TaxID=49447 RepID=A0AAJ0UG11_HALSE|nr:hypothetical protein [Halochromatium salexigens]MBK5930215.1 hypothetical protein [Halochromatium salexigens]
MASTASENESHPIWELIPLAHYQLPSAPTASSAKRGLSSLKRFFRWRRPAPQGPVKREDELHALAPERLEAVAGPIDWRAAARVLQTALEQRAPTERVWFIIGPPTAGYAELLETWAEQHDRVCIPAPAPEVVTGNHSGWLADWPQDGCLWALPRLERCWLRHPAGLDLIRGLFERLLSARQGFGLIGCDSWTWAYLRFVVPTPAVRALTLQALDGERLARWLASLAAGHDQRPRRFRHAQSGNRVLTVNGGEEMGESAANNELRYLAAQARGNPGVALQRWRSRLRSEPDKPEAADEESDDQPDVETIWVAPALEFALPSGWGEPEALILHALLLHDGLPTEILAALLPAPRARTRDLLWQLAASDVISADPEGIWRVTPSAYPAVRSFLAERDFLTDAC